MKITCQRVGSVDVIVPDSTLGEDNSDEFLAMVIRHDSWHAGQIAVVKRLYRHRTT